MAHYTPQIPEEIRQTNKLNYCAMLPPLADHTTQLVNFPKMSCFGRWGRQGKFWVTTDVYQDGKERGCITAPRVDEEGCLFSDLNHFDNLLPGDKLGLLVLETYASEKVPLELYFSHVHKKSGIYFSYPAAAYMGDQLYPANHREQMENVLFWPGVIHQERCESSLVVMNPYHVPASYQITLFRPDGEQVHSKVHKISAWNIRIFRIAELFDELHGYESDTTSAQYSVCASSSSKLIVYHAITDRTNGQITSMDHMHVYQPY